VWIVVSGLMGELAFDYSLQVRKGGSGDGP
jgi:hypothetical protein